MKKRSTVFLGIALCMLSFQGIAQKKISYGKVIAHRGAWKNTGAPQNSIASLKEAMKLNCYGSEFDVWMTADSVLVVNHDPLFYGLSIEKLSYAELLQQKHPNGESIPTLEAYLKTGKGQKKTRLILEIKSSVINKERTLALTTKCVQMVRDLKVNKIVDYIMFDYDACKLANQLDPKAQVTYLNGDRTPAQLAGDKIDGLDYNHAVLKKNEDWIKEAHQKNLSVNVWTVNDKTLMSWFLERKVDFITTDEPEQLLEIVRP